MCNLSLLGPPPNRTTHGEPVDWGQVELDLFGPFVCRSDVNKRSSKKIWGIVFVDINSNAVHCDIVLDYSAKEVVNALSRFISIRGHPSKIMSDPGSQLTSVSGDLKSWWSEIGKGIVDNTA